MQLKWTAKGLADVTRLHSFLAHADPAAAASTVQSLIRAPELLVQTPRMGEQIWAFAPREVRRILVGPYEVRYEIQELNIFILRVWHTREKR